MANTKAAGDPRYRPFRIAAYLLYLVVVIGFSSLIIFSVVRSVIAMTPPRLPPIEPTLTVRECLDRADLLWKELEAQRTALAERPRTREGWTAFRLEWLGRHRQAEAACALGSSQRKALKQVYVQLEKVMGLYTTHAVQYSGEIGPTIAAMRAASEKARQDALR